MSTQLTFPSDAAPAFPAITLELPDNWAPFSTTGAVLSAGRESAHGEFRPNVVVTVSRYGSDFTLEQASADVVALVEALDGVVELGQDTLTVLGQEGFRIEFSYHHARGDRAASEGRAAAFAGTSLISQSRFRGANHNMSISFPSWSMALARLP